VATSGRQSGIGTPEDAALPVTTEPTFKVDWPATLLRWRDTAGAEQPAAHSIRPALAPQLKARKRLAALEATSRDAPESASHLHSQPSDIPPIAKQEISAER
jgi:hypothetical protein